MTAASRWVAAITAVTAVAVMTAATAVTVVTAVTAVAVMTAATAVTAACRCLAGRRPHLCQLGGVNLLFTPGYLFLTKNFFCSYFGQFLPC